MLFVAYPLGAISLSPCDFVVTPCRSYFTNWHRHRQREVPYSSTFDQFKSQHGAHQKPKEGTGGVGIKCPTSGLEIPPTFPVPGHLVLSSTVASCNSRWLQLSCPCCWLVTPPLHAQHPGRSIRHLGRPIPIHHPRRTTQHSHSSTRTSTSVTRVEVQLELHTVNLGFFPVYRSGTKFLPSYN
jgi:hypothetical protein